MTWATDHRPKRFADLVAQDHVGLALPRMVAAARQGTRRFPPALTLFGPRGVGKTTVARILAKALNCTTPADGEPCAVCATCLSIDAGTSPGVTEIDMASHGGVEDMRQIKTNAAYGIAEFWRVYLMDEIHSASRDAFNALLKILEEPPPYTLFCMVTTEPERIPETIRSRAMEFEFRRISAEAIAARLQSISQDEGVDAEGPLLRFLATRARGGMRDAIMALEQVTAASDPNPPTLALAHHVLGVSDSPERLLSAALAGDLAEGLSALTAAAYSGTSPAVLADDLLGGLTALVAVRTGLPAQECQDGSVSPEWLRAHAQAATVPTLLAGVRDLWNARSRIRGHDPASPTHLTAAYLSLCQALTPGSQSQAQGPRSVDRGSSVTPASPWEPGTEHLDPKTALDQLASL